MKADFAVRWTLSAEKDLRSIIDYIAEDSPDSALGFLQEFRKKAASLNSMPQKGRIVPELREHGILNYRELVFSPWRIIYKISAKEVYVLAVIDSRRNVEDLLLDRFVVQK